MKQKLGYLILILLVLGLGGALAITYRDSRLQELKANEADQMRDRLAQLEEAMRELEVLNDELIEENETLQGEKEALVGEASKIIQEQESKSDNLQTEMVEKQKAAVRAWRTEVAKQESRQADLEKRIQQLQKGMANQQAKQVQALPPSPQAQPFRINRAAAWRARADQIRLRTAIEAQRATNRQTVFNQRMKARQAREEK
jgi:hypothetical protein